MKNVVGCDICENEALWQVNKQHLGPNAKEKT